MDFLETLICNNVLPVLVAKHVNQQPIIANLVILVFI